MLANIATTCSFPTLLLLLFNAGIIDCGFIPGTCHSFGHTTGKETPRFVRLWLVAVLREDEDGVDKGWRPSPDNRSSIIKNKSIIMTERTCINPNSDYFTIALNGSIITEATIAAVGFRYANFIVIE